MRMFFRTLDPGRHSHSQIQLLQLHPLVVTYGTTQFSEPLTFAHFRSSALNGQWVILSFLNEISADERISAV